MKNMELKWIEELFDEVSLNGELYAIMSGFIEWEMKLQSDNILWLCFLW